MSEAIMIWVYLSLGSVVTIGWMLISLTIISAIFLAIYFSSDYEYRDRIPKDWEIAKNRMMVIKKYYPIKSIILITALVILYPSKDDLKYIIGGSLVINGAQAASDIEGVEKLPENLVNAMNVFLEKAVDDNTNR